VTRGTTQDITSDCDREQVHTPGSIQPFGVLVAFALPAWTVAHVSLNAADFFGAADATTLIDRPIDQLLSPKLVHDLRNTFQAAMISGLAERLAAIVIGPEEKEHDILVFASGSLAIAEFIPAIGSEAGRSDPATLVKTVIDRLRRTTNFSSFLNSASRQLRAMTGFDRVMVYKFLEDDSGQVVAEALRAGLDPFLNLRYPTSDIPPQARALFKRQWLRMIPDIDYVPIPIVPQLTTKHMPLDLSMSTLRSASPIHIQYLRNMGSAATLTISIMQGDRLWGLVACHHESPRRISASTSAAVELFAQVFSTQIEAKQQRDELAAAEISRKAHDRLIATMRPEETIFQNLAEFSPLLRAMIDCDGIGILTEGRFESEGSVPPLDAIEELGRFLNLFPSDRIFVTQELSRHLPDALRYIADVSGLIAIPVSHQPKDYLLLFRREVVQTVAWGGDPTKPVTASGPGRHISPRASFAAWKELVSGTSLPWRPNEIAAAELLRVSLLDMMLRRASLIDRERRVAQESQLLLVAELNHRVKNVLAVIRSLVRQSVQGAKSIETFTADLQQRIHALSLAHDQLTQAHWKAAPLHTLIEAEARAWTQDADKRLTLCGVPVMIEARGYQTLALVLHEMMTNAAKHGALSAKTGHVTIAWHVTEDGNLVIDWTEADGPEVLPPARRGFGSIVVEQSIPFELKGEASIDYRQDGVRARFLIPADFVREGHSAPTVKEPSTCLRADLRGKSLLLVEDSMMIALDAQTMLQNCGAEVELAATTLDARRAIRLNRFDAAILDVNLYTETSFGIAEDLQERQIPFVFATGYGETVTLPDRFRDVLVISKPYAEDSLRAALAA
jgi:light-regulated signal transduction histidine kinase (bacteriophytochrome)